MTDRLIKSNLCLIYIIKNTVNHKVYIGQTWRSIPQRKRTGYEGCCHLWNAMNKYGEDKFYHQAITIANTREIADYWEEYFIKQYKSDDPNFGYNISPGGRNTAKITKAKMSIARKKRGKFSDETKEAIAKTKRGDKNPSKKINSTIARQIYLDYLNDTKATCSSLSAKYSIDRSNIGTIIAKTSWIEATQDLPDINYYERYTGLNSIKISEIKTKILNNQSLTSINEYEVGWHTIRDIRDNMKENEEKTI